MTWIAAFVTGKKPQFTVPKITLLTFYSILRGLGLDVILLFILEKENFMHIHTRKFAMIGGWVMLVMGILSLIPTLSQNTYLLPALRLENSYGLFLGFFPMNILNKLALILFGVAGIMASRTDDVIASVKYSRIVCVAMGGLALLGLFPSTNTLFGYWPLFGGEIVGHGIFALLGGYFGYAVPASIKRTVDL